MKKPVLVVLAAGMGSRYGGLKQMDSMTGYGQNIIDYSVYDARRAGFEEVIFIIKRELEEDFRARVGDRIARGIRVKYAFQELNDLPDGFTVPPQRTKPWGTTHALLAARDLIDGPFAVINADDYYGPQAFRDMYRYLCDHQERHAYAMAGYLLGNTVSEFGSVARGVCQMDESGFLTRIVEHTKIFKHGDGGRFTPDDGETWIELPGTTLVSMNFWGFQPSFLEEGGKLFVQFLEEILRDNPEKGEVYLPLPVGAMVESGRAAVKVLPCHDKWFGVTYREDKESVVTALQEMTASGLYPEELWAE